jgi:putative ABC transport system substrate-binding protein
MTLKIGRRKFVCALGGAAAWPFAVRAQQAGKVYRIGFLANDPTIPATTPGTAFREGLRESGFVEGQNIVIEWRFAEGRVDVMSELAGQLVRLDVDLIVASANAAILAAKQATPTIPIIMVNAQDPVAAGIAPSLAAPAGNVTGVVQMESADIAGKRLQLLQDVVPQLARVAVMINPDSASDQSEWGAIARAASSLGVMPQAIPVRQGDQLAGAFARITRERCDALLGLNNGFHLTYRKVVVGFAAENRLPAMYSLSDFTRDGGLMSYGAVRAESYRHVAAYVAKILKGAKPADLPIEQPTKYELIVNLKTAKALGLSFPREFLLVADEVIE